MPAHMTRENKRAHSALEDWASYIHLQGSSEIGFAITEWKIRVQTPPRALIPRVAFTPPTVKAVENWYSEATETLKRHAYMYYLSVPSQHRMISSSQYKYLLRKVSKYLQNIV